MEAIITASWADTSTNWGRPEARALRVAMAASGPTWAHAVGSVQRTGARSGSPVQYMFPVEAMTPRSLAIHAGPGPVEPEGRDRHPYRAGGERAVDLERAGPSRRGEHHVGPGQQRGQRGVGRPRDLDRRLPRVPDT